MKVFGDRTQVKYSTQYNEVNTFIYRGMKLGRVYAYDWFKYVDYERTMIFHTERVNNGRLDARTLEILRSELVSVLQNRGNYDYS